ncbi:insulinase family protein [Leptolyngbya sp. 15MV]|nr:insulinase family protein [Leptolyngbya sp. 15MV]
MTDAIQLTRLPSGLTVVSERMPRVETVSLGAYVDAGTRHESAPENGVSHFLEHMAFKGTAKRDAAAIAREIENVGGHINAYTSRENTAFYCKVLKEDSALAADIIGDILSHSTCVAEELERERGVILQEIGQANDTPDDVIFDHFQSTAYAAQAMGRPVLGTEDTIKAMSRDALCPASSSVVSASSGAPRSSFLPTTRGRSGSAYSASFNCGSRKARRSSMTSTSSSPFAKLRAPSASSGQASPTFQMRNPCWRATSGVMPASDSASRSVAKALPRTAMPKRAFGLSITMRSSPLARAKATAAGSFTRRSRRSCATAGSGMRRCTPSAGKSKAGAMVP